MDFITTPDVLGPQAVDGPGWPAQFGLGVSSRMLEVDKDIFNNRASQHGVSGFTEEAAKSNNGFSKDNAPTSVCTSHIRDKALVVVRADGFDSSAEADFKAKEPLGAAFDWTKVDTAVLGAHHLIFLVEGPAKVPVILTTTEGYIIKVQSDPRTVKHLATQPMIAKVTEIRPRIAKVTAEDRDPNVISRVHE